MKCYVIKADYILADILEAEIIKETEKQYKIKIEEGKWSYIYTVNKSKMHFGDLDKKILCLTKEEAEKTRLQLLKENLEHYKAKQLRYGELITQTKQCIDEIEKGDGEWLSVASVEKKCHKKKQE